MYHCIPTVYPKYTNYFHYIRAVFEFEERRIKPDGNNRFNMSCNSVSSWISKKITKSMHTTENSLNRRYCKKIHQQNLQNVCISPQFVPKWEEMSEGNIMGVTMRSGENLVEANQYKDTSNINRWWTACHCLEQERRQGYLLGAERGPGGKAPGGVPKGSGGSETLKLSVFACFNSMSQNL